MLSPMKRSRIESEKGEFGLGNREGEGCIQEICQGARAADGRLWG